MQTNSEILRLQGLLFGFWQATEEIYYFGHIPDNAASGTVEISYKSFELHISNFEYTLTFE
jgi:hypothetical protein